VIAIGVLTLFGLVVLWGVTSYLSVRDGVNAANKRLQPGTRAVLAKQDGLLLSHASTILLLGSDSGPQKGRAGDRHSDSIMLLRTDPDHHRLAYLSIPRDLYVPVSGLGNAKINAAFQRGGAPLAIRTIRQYTGMEINHVVVVDFSNFEKGRQHMDGKRALIYSRIRENRLNPRETDFTRAARQQDVMQAAMSGLTSTGTLFKLPFDGDSLLKPLATDLTTWEIIQLGWVKTRASRGNTLYCRLGGDPSTASGQSVIIPSEDNRNALAMWRGDSAPQRPTTSYGPGCVKGHPLR
jgi:anionic cell wall polymer biosynthesis LytR-Cps2A-Psr (LCP) family protein